MAFENMPDDGTRRMPPPKTQEAAPQDASGEWECPNQAGRVIANPISGEQIVIHTSGTETDGKLLVFDLFLPPGKHVPSWHTHPIQEERFAILAGTMRFRLGWHRILATTLLAGLFQWWRTRDQGDSLEGAQRLADIVGVDYYPRYGLLSLAGRTLYMDGSRMPCRCAGAAS